MGKPIQLLFAAGALAAALTGPMARAEAPAPRLIIAVAVDQLSADLYAEYRAGFTGGMRRMAAGVVFPSGYQSHAATETCPGHSTILTGDHPSRTGVIANNWWDYSIPRAAKQVYCSEDPALSDGASANYVVSPMYLRVPTLGERMKAANPNSRVVVVSGKDRAAMMMGGKSPDEVWYWRDRDRAFVTLAGRTSRPAALAPVNARAARELATGAPARLPAACRARSSPVKSGARTLGVAPSREKDVLGDFRADGVFDTLTMDLAVGLIREMKLGKGQAPDLLAIGLSGTDYVGHHYGPGGAEMCAQMQALDRNMGQLFAALDALKVPYVVMLTADHGGHDAPERHDQRAQPTAQRMAPDLAMRTLGEAVARDVGLTGAILDGESIAGDIYVSSAVPAALKPRVVAAARARLAAHPQIAAVFTAAEVRASPRPTTPPPEWTLLERFRESYDAQRSGDLMAALKPNVTGIIAAGGGSVATHGSPWDYDRRVPILFYRSATTGFEQPLPVETVDIAPTLAALIGLAIAKGEMDGRCLDLDPGPGDTCPQ